MRKKYQLLLSALFAVFFSALMPALAQPKIDSLKALLARHPSPDTLRIDLLNQLGYEYWVISPAQSDYYGTLAMQLADSLNYPEGIAYAGRVIGVSHWTRGNYSLSLTFLLKSLDDYRHIGDRLGEANVTMNLGLVYADQTDHEKALKHYFDAISLFKALNKTDRIGTTYTKIGSSYLATGQLDMAYDYFMQALAIHKEQQFNYGIEEVTNRLGQLFFEKKEPARALGYLSESLEMATQLGDQENIARNQALIGHLYLQQDRLTDAAIHLDKALKTARANGLKKIIRDVYFYQKELARTQGNYQAALDHMSSYVAISDSLFNEEKAVQMANLQTAYELREKNNELRLKQNEIELLEASAKMESWLRWSLIGGVVMLSVLGFLIISRQRLKIRTGKELAAKAEALLSSARALAQAELENARLREQELMKELEFKNKELTSYTINFIRKNELLEELTDDIKKIRQEADPQLGRKLNQLHRNVENTLQIDKDWEDFKKYFENVHSQFFSRLKERYAGLTPTDLKMCALIRLNLSMKEIATIMGISPESVKTSRYRLRKKLGLDHDENLLNFLFDLEQKGAGTP